MIVVVDTKRVEKMWLEDGVPSEMINDLIEVLEACDLSVEDDGCGLDGE